MSKYELTELTPREHVGMIGKVGYIDDDKDIQMRVVSVTFGTNRITYTMGWFHNGASYEAPFDMWRVTIHR